MEVHHHPQVEKKRFREYFLEFLMIFLAVTLGFFAENIREHLSDKSKEKDYVISIRKDVVADTASLNVWIPNLFQKVAEFDTLISLLQQQGQTPRGSDLYYYARLSTRSRVFNANNNTIVELKNSGNLRFIRNKAVINGLTNFQKIVDNYLNLNTIDKKESEMLYPLLGKLFDATVFNGMIKADAKASAYSIDSATSSLMLETMLRPTGNPQLLNHNADDINLLIFYLH